MHAAAGFEADCEASGAGQGGCGVTGLAGHPSAAIEDGEQPADHRGRATGLAGTRDIASVRLDISPASTGAESDSTHGSPQTETESEHDETNIEVQVCSPGHDRNTRPLHFYVDVPDAHESTYDVCDWSVGIDPGFHAQLREDDDHDISSFLALPELIPTRKRKRQQPLLDFTRSKILTSQAYTDGCERLLAQREAHQEQARRKVADREATKEQRRKEKEEKDLQVCTRKEARAAKKLETKCLQVKRRARRKGGRCGCGRASDGGRSCAPGNEAHMVPTPAQLRAEALAPVLLWPTPSTQSPFFLNPTLMMPGHFPQPFQRSHDLNGHPWIVQSSLPGGGDNTVGSQVLAVRFMAPDSEGSGAESRGMGTWQSNLWGI